MTVTTTTIIIIAERTVFSKLQNHFLEGKNFFLMITFMSKNWVMGRCINLTHLAGFELLKNSAKESMVTSVRLTVFFLDL